MTRIEFSEHAKLKLKERGIDKIEVLNVLKVPLSVFLDVETGNLVVVGNRIHKLGHQLIIVYSIIGNIIKVVTVIDVSKSRDIIKRREKKGRWVKIR